ncbi:MAG TPA: RnfABCDGE type electron transport complex subunit B [Burkholderiales bacterium]|nr:RnfABCDGE type electron transport complex subunit B [Burkholderiales bacterium]
MLIGVPKEIKDHEYRANITLDGVCTPTAGDLSKRIDALLPQTQCRQCGYAGCRPYAEAVAAGDADINRCPPGGADVIEGLALLLGREPTPLDESCGITKAPAVALIDETWCIGCTLCIQACPVDAIAGAAKVMHTVIAAECTGCELCIPPCPVDCIQMVPVELSVDRNMRVARTAHWRDRHLARQTRLTTAADKAQAKDRKTATNDNNRKQAAVARALARAQERIKKNV